MPDVMTLEITINETLGPALLGELQKRHAHEQKLATKECREPTTLTLNALGAVLIAEKLGVTNFEPPKRGRRWPKKEQE